MKSRRLVNVGKIMRIVRAKLYNSELSDEFMKYLVFVTIYIIILFVQRNGLPSHSKFIFQVLMPIAMQVSRVSLYTKQSGVYLWTRVTPTQTAS